MTSRNVSRSLGSLRGRREDLPAIGKASPALGKDSRSPGNLARSLGKLAKSRETFPGHRESLPIAGNASPSSGKLAQSSGILALSRASLPGRRESSLLLGILARDRKQKWQSFGYSSSEANVLKVEGEEEAHPFAVEGGGVVSRETHFAARTSPDGTFANFLRSDDFLKLLPKAKFLDMSLTTRIHGESPQTVKCKVVITERLIKTLNEKRWSAPSCLKSERATET